MRIAVVGAGAMGSMLAARFSLAGMDVVLLGRPSPHMDAVRERGLTLEEEDGERRLIPLNATDDASAVADRDLVVLLVKAWATAGAVAPLRSHLKAAATLVTLQNGLGNTAAIRAALGSGHEAAIVLGITSQAAWRLAPGLVRHTGRGPTVVGHEDGAADGRLADAAGAFAAAMPPAVAVTDIQRWAWRKLAVNAAINGLTALAGVPNGGIVTDPGLRGAATDLAREVEAVARAKGIELGDVVAAVEEVARATAANRSSMLIDLDAGGPTEVDAIYGIVLRAGAAAGIDTPANRTVAALIRARERDSAKGRTGAAAKGEERR